MENERVASSLQQESGSPGNSTFGRLSARLQRLERYLDKRSFAFLSAVVILLAFVKHGPRMYMTFGDSLLAVDGPETAFPTVIFSRWLLFARLLQIPNRLVFEIFTFLVSIAILSFIAYLLHRSLPRPSSIVALMAIALGQIGLVLTSQFGSADQLLLLGAALLVLTRKNAWALWALGAALLAIGNPGQAVVASISLLLLSQVALFREYRARSILALALSSLWFLLDTVLTQANQADAIDDRFGESLFVSAVAGPFRIYSMYGVLWFLVIVVILSSSKRKFGWLTLALILVPFVFVLSTTDGTRVGVGATSLALLALIMKCTQPIVTWVDQNIGFPSSLALIVLLVVPSVNLLGLDVVLPWDWVQHEIRFWIAVSQR